MVDTLDCNWSSTEGQIFPMFLFQVQFTVLPKILLMGGSGALRNSMQCEALQWEG